MTTTTKKEKKGSGIKGQPVRGFGPDIPDTPTSAQIHAPRRPGACKGAFRSSPDTPSLLFRPRTPNCLSSLRAPAALIPSKISVPHLPLNPSGSPPLSLLFPPTLWASAPGTSPVCKIRQAPDWLVCAPAERVTQDSAIQSTGLGGGAKRRTSCRAAFWPGKKMTRLNQPIREWSAGWKRKEETVLRSRKASALSLGNNGRWRTLARSRDWCGKVQSRHCGRACVLQADSVGGWPQPLTQL